MAPTPSSTPRQLHTRGRSTRNTIQRASPSESPTAVEPPSKRRKFAPGAGARSVARNNRPIPILEEVHQEATHGRSRARPNRESLINEAQPVPSPRPRRESRRERMPARPRFSSAAAAAAAVVHGDGFKPREERGWEEFHQDLDIDAKFPVFSSHQVDGTMKSSSTSNPNTPNGTNEHTLADGAGSDMSTYAGGQAIPSSLDGLHTPITPTFTPRRRPGRPPRRPGSMLKGIGVSPDMPKIVPPPGFNPREKLTLPKPSFRPVDPYAKFEDREEFVDQAMANVGFQKGGTWARPNAMLRVTEGNIEDDLVLKTKHNDKDDGTGIGPFGVGRVEYDMDEQDTIWLEAYNETRKEEDIPEIKPWIFEVTMTKIEKEWHALEKRIPKPNPKPPQTHRPRSSSAAAVNGELAAPGEEQDSKCAICDDGDCENTNAIVFCDGCDLAVHQECYGVPFIPEGQWLCRKCQLIGRGTPTCIFCPNTDGAFKQTNASRWSHLLCAIWIPEVSIGNTTFMEPVMEVEKVPKQRWKLTCYICRQRMGACIQCGNKNCYIAFHVTCARRARLFLKMKSTHGGPASLDASVLKAFCDKHVPAEWRREHDVDHAIIQAMDYYRCTMRGRLWADSQQAALTAIPPPPQNPLIEGAGEEQKTPKITLKLGTKNANRQQPPKIVWKLPSGAPVIPQALYNSVESSIARFMIQKRKDFASEVCKYWTLKREARRGAALLKRLQLQMETFTSMEIPRRNFVGMGAAGGVRLQRRIDFAQTLLEEVEKTQKMCALIMDREREKLEDAKLLQEIVDTVYFPTSALLSPILQKARAIDSTGYFEGGLLILGQKLESRLYISVLDFTRDLGLLIADLLHAPETGAEGDGQATSDNADGHKLKQSSLKARKAVAKRLIKAVQASLEEAVRNECQLLRVPSEAEIGRLNAILDESLSTETVSLMANGDRDAPGHPSPELGGAGLTNGLPSSAVSPKSNESQSHTPGTNGMIQPKLALRGGGRTRRSTASNEDIPVLNGHARPLENVMEGKGLQVSPKRKEDERPLPARDGGVPWYMQNFRPEGTRIQEEQWSGRELVREMSEDLSDMDEEEMSGLMNGHADTEMGNTSVEEDLAAKAALAAEKKRKAYNAKRRRNRRG